MSLSQTEYPASEPRRLYPRTGLKWLAVSLLTLLTGYLTIVMYAQGEYLFAMLTLILLGGGLYIFANRRAYAWRYVYPGLAGMGLFVLLPLICTIAIAFTNYSSTNQLSQERAQSSCCSACSPAARPTRSACIRTVASGAYSSLMPRAVNATFPALLT